MKVYYDQKINDYVYFVSNPVKVIAVKPLDEYKLLLSFSTGEQRIYDLNPMLNKPAFASLNNKAFFYTAKVECGTVIWNDEIDLCPESLYRDSLPFGTNNGEKKL